MLKETFLKLWHIYNNRKLGFMLVRMAAIQGGQPGRGKFMLIVSIMPCPFIHSFLELKSILYGTLHYKQNTVK